jgi:3-oxoacyl-[acyl-carrier-protein] synthase II
MLPDLVSYRTFRRVVVTGIGILSPVGNGKNRFFESLAAGRSAIRRLSAPFVTKLSSQIAAELEFDGSAHFPRRKLSGLDRTTQTSLVVAKEALEDSGLVLDDAFQDRTGVFWGTGMASATSIEENYEGLLLDPAFRVHPGSVVRMMNNAATAHISLDFGLRGPSLTYTTACSSSAVAVGEAFRSIRFGFADCAITGGADSLLTYGVIKSWQALQILALEDPQDPSTSCRPFSLDRTGFVLGEGATAFILEEAEHALRRGARIYAEMRGYGCTSDGSHITKPDVRGQAHAISSALREAEIHPGDIGYINAHGTATRIGDIVETEAIKQVFGSHARTVPISSTKSMHGHSLGAAGAMEFAAALLAMQHGVAPPTAHLKAPDPECDLDYVPNQCRENVRIRAVMSNSFAFGGSNAVLVARAWD